MSNIKAMPMSTQCNSNNDVAAFLRLMADQIEGGKRGDIRTAILTMEVAGEGMATFPVGYRGLDNARVMGLLFLALNTYMDSQWKASSSGD